MSRNSDRTRPAGPSQRPAVFRHSGLLGTVIDIPIGALDDESGDLMAVINDTVVAEIERLEQVFSTYVSTSEFRRWCRGEATTPSADFAELMDFALAWQHRSSGGFNPLVGELSVRWKQAELDDRLPSDSELSVIVSRIGEPRYVMVDGRPTAIADCSLMNLNAIAKGYIVDRAIEGAAALLDQRSSGWISVNAGGDLAHRSSGTGTGTGTGTGSIRVGIANPHRPYDNEPPLTTIELSNAALATSGLARRGFRIEGCWYGHVFDPRSGWPIEAIASISVIAPNAATADVVATAAGVLPPDQALSFVDDLDEVEAMIVGNSGEHLTTAGWPPPALHPHEQ